jgi:hypothetical protein
MHANKKKKTLLFVFFFIILIIINLKILYLVPLITITFFNSKFSLFFNYKELYHEYINFIANHNIKK